MFCVECGKEGSIFKDGVCVDCYLKTHTFTKGPALIDIPLCTHCESYKYKNTWTSELFGDVIRRIIKNNFQISRELKNVDINTECKEAKEGMVCKVYISGFLDNVEINEDHDLEVRFKRTVCDVCSKRFGGYHEAIVQIRTDKKELSKKNIENIRTIVDNLVENLRAKGSRGLFITDIGEERGGLDFYISEKGPSLIIAKKIQDRYGGVIKQSSKNIGMKDGKQLYRVTYSVRIPSYQKGDFIKHDNSAFSIISVHGNKVKMINLKDWETTSVDFKTLEKSTILGDSKILKEMILVSQTEEEVQLMDPKTYKIQTIKKPKPITLKTEKVKILRTEKQTLLMYNN